LNAMLLFPVAAVITALAFGLLPAAAFAGPPAPPSPPAPVAQDTRAAEHARSAPAQAPRGQGGAVAAADPAAVAVGLDVLRAGGNAVDAAVATALALAVVFPEAGNLGGGGFAVVRVDGEIHALDFREVGPAAAKHDMYRDKNGKVVPDLSRVGALAVGVPGSPAGLYELHRKLGKLPWAKVVEPARHLAAQGFVIDQHLHDLLGKPETRKLLGRFPESAAVWLPKGDPPAVGSTLRLPSLAATLDGYAHRGPEAVMTGPVAAAVEAVSRRHGGILTAEDLAAYKPVWRQPVNFASFGWKFASMPLPSSGGILMGQTLEVLERLGWAKLPRGGADRAHLLAEAFRGAYADRFLLGDPATTQADAAQLLDPAWIAQRAAGIDLQHARVSSNLLPWPGKPMPAGVASREKTETTHLSVVDAQGNLVALTTTLNDLFGSGLWVTGAGFFLNDEMDDFAAAPGQPNLFKLIQGEANAVRPGKRMLSSMAPTIAWKGKEAVALGGRGGSRIPTNTLQVLLNLLVDGDDLQAALTRPRLHHQWLPDQLDAEPDALTSEAVADLERRGHTVKITTDSAKVHIVRLLADGRMEAASDPRGPGVGGVVTPEK
ncbi:MAG: gamma-glutamyltranspeptidase / glutathione hydrolase, partial [Acidobacteriota bacterium]|nr:gamma-glutamyltranspeptidase / glutathione hydrolase [Acidobacteriota bacterium]